MNSFRPESTFGHNGNECRKQCYRSHNKNRKKRGPALSQWDDVEKAVRNWNKEQSDDPLEAKETFSTDSFPVFFPPSALEAPNRNGLNSAVRNLRNLVVGADGRFFNHSAHPDRNTWFFYCVQDRDHPYASKSRNIRDAFLEHRQNCGSMLCMKLSNDRQVLEVLLNYKHHPARFEMRMTDECKEFSAMTNVERLGYRKVLAFLGSSAPCGGKCSP
ncbi:hypothetical protein K470DRAFT_118554 [Piedraia hortae CBS 480.64]|uniref:Uncharacterized protein n=1 Tax=Piedraia hortae CBS 480.64 TaxID=1314780 RepID=A0A6A7BU93_9PEZI|nr:hypothetical protein K470DRAFT_118554 [Piedraia hortae CBS 480.64]